MIPGALVAIAVLALASCTAQHMPTPNAASQWTITYSTGLPVAMLPAIDGYYFDFPQAPGSVHYVTRKVPESARSSIRMRIRIEGDAQFKATEGDAPAAVRLMVQRRGDTLSWDKVSFRFWSNPAVIVLAPGEFILEVPLTPDQWTNVGGQQDAAGLQALLGDLDNIGFTFGGMFFGHGVYSIGPARFALLEYTLN